MQVRGAAATLGAEDRPARLTVAAGATEGDEVHHHMVAGAHVGHALAHLLHDASGLVAQDRWQLHRPQPLDLVEVAVADAAGDGLDHDLAGPGVVDIDLLNDQWLVDFVEDGGLHDGLLPRSSH